MSRLVVFCDGACSGNPGPGGWGAIISSSKDVIELGGHEPGTTNNRMEMRAALEALTLAQARYGESVQIELFTDSKYLIEGITKWIHGWKKKNWKSSTGESVKNQDLWERLDQKQRDFKTSIEWKHVDGHSGIPGNERCDEIAVAFSEGSEPDLYRGDRLRYSVDLSEGLILKAKAQKKNIDKSKVYYLSVVSGIVYRDQTWAACEARVRGARGARYKKVYSLQDETEVLKSWGISK